MSQIHNPYIVGSPISGEAGFYGRRDILDFVRTVLSTSDQNVVVLYGQRRIGKTSILHQLTRYLPADFAPVYFDLQGQARRPLPDVLYDLARRISQTLKITLPERNSFKRDENFFEANFLPAVLEILGPRRLVLLFDEFDALSDDLPPAEDAFRTFFPYLQQLTLDMLQLAFVLVIGRQIDELPRHFGQIFKTAQFKPVSRLLPQHGRRLITKPTQEILHYEDAAVERILALTANHPYFTQLLCFVIFEQARQLNSDTITLEQVDEAIEEALAQGEGGFAWLWEGLPGAERVVLSAIASAAGEFGSVSDSRLRQILEENHIKLLGPELTAAPKRLVEWDILGEAEGSGFCFVVDLMRRWVRHQHPIQSATHDLGYLSQRAARLYENARDAHLSGDYETAIGDYRQALAVNPNHPWAPLGLAQALHEAGRLVEAVEAYEQAFRRGDEVARDGLVEATTALARGRAGEKQWGEAIQLFDRALALRPDRYDREVELEAKFAQAMRLKEQDQLHDSLEILREIIYEEEELKYEDQG
jgi:tetratricopeptide (TPR) repeat protein